MIEFEMKTCMHNKHDCCIDKSGTMTSLISLLKVRGHLTHCESEDHLRALAHPGSQYAASSSTMMSPLTPFKDCGPRKARGAVSFTRVRHDANPAG